MAWKDKHGWHARNQQSEASATIENSGFNYSDPVVVDHLGEKNTRGIIEAIHTGGKKVDVRIDHPGHKEHGRVVTFPTNNVGRRAA